MESLNEEAKREWVEVCKKEENNNRNNSNYNNDRMYFILFNTNSPISN